MQCVGGIRINGRPRPYDLYHRLGSNAKGSNESPNLLGRGIAFVFPTLHLNPDTKRSFEGLLLIASVVPVGAIFRGIANQALKSASEGFTTLWRVVRPEELADIEAQGVFRNLGWAEGKYFSTTAEGAASYGKQAFYSFKDPPYTLVSTEVPNSLLEGLDIITVDGNVPAVVIPNEALPALKPEVLNYMPIPAP